MPVVLSIKISKLQQLEIVAAELVKSFEAAAIFAQLAGKYIVAKLAINESRVKQVNSTL